MACQRCDGLMVQERYGDLESGSAGHEIFGWRCLNCGAIVDPEMATHRRTTRKTEPDHLWRQRLKELLTAA